MNIYYKSLGIQLIIESPEYTLSTLLSALGGALSIFQGLTLLIIFEAVSILTGVFLYAVLVPMARGGSTHPKKFLFHNGHSLRLDTG